MIEPSDFLKWLNVFGVVSGGGGGGAVTALQVQRSAFNAANATGADDAFVVNLTPAVTALTNGLLVTMVSGTLTNLTTTPTLQINALTPVNIVLWSGQVVAGDIQAHSTYLFIYNLAANVFELINPSISLADTFATQANTYNYALDAGSVNAYSGTINPFIFANITDGFATYIRVTHTTTAAATLTINTHTAPIVNVDGTALIPGNIVINQVCFFIYNANYSAWTLMNPLPVAADNIVQWHPIAGTTQAAAVNSGYVIQNAAQTTVTLPATAILGSVVSIRGFGAGGWVLVANTGQTINVDGQSTTSGGSLTSAGANDTIDVTCVVANTTWTCNGLVTSGFTYA